MTGRDTKQEAAFSPQIARARRAGSIQTYSFRASSAIGVSPKLASSLNVSLGSNQIFSRNRILGKHVGRVSGGNLAFIAGAYSPTWHCRVGGSSARTCPSRSTRQGWKSAVVAVPLVCCRSDDRVGLSPTGKTPPVLGARYLLPLTN